MTVGRRATCKTRTAIGRGRPAHLRQDQLPPHHSGAPPSQHGGRDSVRDVVLAAVDPRKRDRSGNRVPKEGTEEPRATGAVAIEHVGERAMEREGCGRVPGGKRRRRVWLLRARHTRSGRGRPTSAADATKHAVSRASTAAGATAERRSRVNNQVMPHQIAPFAMVCGTPEYHESGSVSRSIGSRGPVGSAGSGTTAASPSSGRCRNACWSARTARSSRGSSPSRSRIAHPAAARTAIAPIPGRTTARSNGMPGA